MFTWYFCILNIGMNVVKHLRAVDICGKQVFGRNIIVVKLV